MGFLDRMDESGRLVDGMATRLGVDLAARVSAAPDLAGPSYRAMVLACTGCAEHGACQRLQAENAHLDSPPSYCRNRSRFGATG
jgi:hypothetical protein